MISSPRVAAREAVKKLTAIYHQIGKSASSKGVGLLSEREYKFPDHMHSLREPSTTGLLHHNQLCDVVVERSDYYIESLIVPQTTQCFWSIFTGHVNRVIMTCVG